MHRFEPEVDDKLSNLTTALVCIERGEGADRNLDKLEFARGGVIEAIGSFHKSRFALGRALAEYKKQYKQDQLWPRARKEIARAIGCNPRTISRIIEESEAATALSPFVLEVMDDRDIDPGKKKNAAIVEELLKCPVPESRQQADTVVRSTVAEFASTQKRAPKMATESIEIFTRRMVKLFRGHFEPLQPTVKISELRYCLEMVLTALRADVGTLNRYESLNDVPKHRPEATKETAAA